MSCLVSIMLKLTNKEKRILAFLVTNCELYHLDENEAMTYIQYNLNRPISRRTFYNYKNRVYKDYEKSSIYSEILKRTHPLTFKRHCNMFLASDKIEMLRKGLREKINLEKYDRLTFIPKYLKVTQARMVTSIERLEKSSIKTLEKSTPRLDLDKESRDENRIPDTASLREEFIKCGKISCFTCPHGPYYYAYWKDNGKLRKKYLGIDQKLASRKVRLNYL